MTDASHSLRRTVRRLSSDPRGLFLAGAGFLLLLVATLTLFAPSPSSAQSPPATPATHTVQAGETLSQIAKRNGLSVEDLMRVNGIPNADAIYVGQRLRFPLAEAPAGVTVHEVEPGEALLQIARLYGVDVRAIMRANDIANPNGIVAGQELIIPEALTAPAGAPAAATRAATATAPLSPTQENSEQAVHTVRPGDSASVIAKRYGVTLTDLLRYNGIANADLIRVGAELVIPPASHVPATPTPQAQTEPGEPTPAAGESLAVNDGPTEVAFASALPESAIPMPERPATSLNREYTVVRGDTIPAIALRLGIDVDALRDLNSVVDDIRLVSGQTLLLPATDRELRVVTPEEEYVVQSGDSLSAIAKRFDLTLADLMSANGMSNPNLVTVGERLTIPGHAVAGERPLERVGPARAGYYYYTVQAGDTLSELARQFDITRLALIKYNNLPDEETVYSGMELRVPYGAPDIPKRFPPVPISGSRFLVSLSRQQCWVYAGREVEYAWNCSTGIEDRRTKTGNFAVQSKIEMAESNVWRLDMPWWLGIYNVGKVENGIHGLPISWTTGEKIWSTLIGQPATFGCAMLGDEDAKTLFDLAYIGMPVHIIQ